LYKFIEEILFILETKNFIPAKISITMMGNNLKAELYGDDASKYNIKEIKASTYAEMKIKKTDSGWTAQMVLDV
jgi:SHS2 domain-containing protein